MDHYPIYASLIIDPLADAWAIETSFANYLNPAACTRGVWYPNRTTPDAVAAHLFYKVSPTSPEWRNVEVTEAKLADFEFIPGDLCDGVGNVVIPEGARKKMAARGVLPLTGMQMVRHAVDIQIAELSRNWTRRCAHSYAEMWAPFLDPRLIDVNPPSSVSQAQHLAAKEKLTDRRDDVISEIKSRLTDTLTRVREFIGNEERDRWTMHFLRVVGTDLHVQKSQDYRIYDWTRRIESGEWV